MRDVDPIDPAERLCGTIRAELAAFFGMRDETVGDDRLDELASALTDQLLYNWQAVWAPSYGNAASHSWYEDGEHFGECIRCGRITAHASEVERDRWLSQHLSECEL